MKTSLATLERVKENVIAQRRVVEDIISNLGTSKQDEVLTSNDIYKLFELNGTHCYTNMMAEGKFDRIVDGKEVPRMRICPEIVPSFFSRMDKIDYCKECAFYSLCKSESSINKQYMEKLINLKEEWIEKRRKPSITHWNELISLYASVIIFIDKKILEMKK